MSNGRLAAAVVAMAVTAAACVSADTNSPISGIWTVRPHLRREFLVSDTYSWGTALRPRNGSIDIDLGSDPPTLTLGYLGGTFDITGFEQLDENTYRIVFWFNRGQFDEVWTMHILGANEAYFVQEEGGLTITGIFGPENVHYRIDGPGIEDPPLRPESVE